MRRERERERARELKDTRKGKALEEDVSGCFPKTKKKMKNNGG